MRAFRRAWRCSVADLGFGDLDISFAVKRKLRAVANTAELKVWNLTSSNRRRLTESRHAPVRLEAGYVAGTWLVFSGDVRKAWNERDGADWITHVTAGDGERGLQTSRVSRSFSRDVRVDAVIQHLATALQVGQGNAVQAFRDASIERVGQVFPSGVVLDGSAARELDALARSCGLEWSVQDGALQVLQRGRAHTRTAVKLTPDTGLVGTPEVGKGGVVKIKALLIPDLIPGRLVQVAETEVGAGTYRIESADYSGDSRGNDWYATLECKVPRA